MLSPLCLHISMVMTYRRPDHPGPTQNTATSAMVTMGDGSTKIELVQLPGGGKVDHALASGRFATETEDGAPFYMAEKVKKAGNSVLHGPIKLQPHNEEVAIVDDIDGCCAPTITVNHGPPPRSATSCIVSPVGQALINRRINQPYCLDTWRCPLFLCRRSPSASRHPSVVTHWLTAGTSSASSTLAGTATAST